MKMIQEKGEGSYRIRAYQGGRVLINQSEYATSVIVTLTELMTDWAPQRVSEIEPGHIEEILALEPEIILLGTGTVQQFPSREVMKTAIQRGVGLEVMDTGSACRTFNLLMAEGRRVAAALMV